MKQQIDWAAMKTHIGKIFNDVKFSLAVVDYIGPWIANTFLEDFPPRIEAVYMRQSQDKRKAEFYNVNSYWEKAPPEDEMMLVAEEVARVAEAYGLSARRIWTDDGRLHYSLKPDRKQFAYPPGTEEETC